MMRVRQYRDKGQHLQRMPTEAVGVDQNNNPQELKGPYFSDKVISEIQSNISVGKENELPSLISEQPSSCQKGRIDVIRCIKQEADDGFESNIIQDNSEKLESRFIVKTESSPSTLGEMIVNCEEETKHLCTDEEMLLYDDAMKMESEDSYEQQLSSTDSILTCKDGPTDYDIISKKDRSCVDNISTRTEHMERVVDQHSVTENQWSAPSDGYSADYGCSLIKVSASTSQARIRKSRKRRSKAKPRRCVSKTSSTITRQPRKRRNPDGNFTSSVNISLLPRRSSNRLRRKQVEQVIDYSQLPPKFTGPLLPSMHFCRYVLEQLMSAKYEPINWLIDLATVKKKLDYRQYEDADEFAAEIRTICMNPLDDSLADDSLSLLRAFEKLWTYMPLDPEIPLVPEDAGDMGELELKYSAILATLINNRKRCQFYGNQLSLHVQRMKEIKEARRTSQQQGISLPEVPPKLKEDTEALAAKLKPYASIPIDVLMEGSLMDSTDRCVAALGTVAPELVEMFGGCTHEQDGGVTAVDECRPNEERPDSENEELVTPEEHEQLAKNVEKLSDEGKIIVLGIIAADNKIEVQSDDEEIHVDLANARPSTFRRVEECVKALMNGQHTCHAAAEDCTSMLDVEAIPKTKCAGNKRTISKTTTSRKQFQSAKKRAVDIEARKRELVEGIKKLGGTGTTRPMRKQVSYLLTRPRARSSYVYRSSSSSSESSTTTTSESWQSDSSSDSENE